MIYIFDEFLGAVIKKVTLIAFHNWGLDTLVK